ncbi:MAG: YHS domain-containing protein [Candidatus Hadarchaeales archaeon]
MEKDPVCNMMVNEKSAKLKVNYRGKTYYFCCPACQKQFEANPEKYAR